MPVPEPLLEEEPEALIAPVADGVGAASAEGDGDALVDGERVKRADADADGVPLEVRAPDPERLGEALCEAVGDPRADAVAPPTVADMQAVAEGETVAEPVRAALAVGASDTDTDADPLVEASAEADPTTVAVADPQ